VDNLPPVKMRAPFPLLLCALLLWPCAAAAAKDIVMPEPEAPTTIFSARVGDADVDLNASGTLQGKVTSTLGLLFVPGISAPLALDSLAPLDSGLFIPSFTPSISISLFLFKRYFLDVSVLSDYTKDSITLGYRGDSTELLRHVLLGNRGVSMEPSGFFEVPDQSESSLGASVLLASGDTTNQFLLRWDSSEEKTKDFIGANEVVRQKVSPDAFIRGRYFFLPDTGVAGLTVYIEDPAGTVLGSDFRKYRAAGFDDVVLDSSGGLVSFKAVPKGRVLVHYTSGAYSVGDVNLGRGALPPATASAPYYRDLGTPTPPGADFDWGQTYLGRTMSSRRVSVAGVDALLLWEPGDTSPFEIDSSYPLTSTPPEDPSRIRIEIAATSPDAAAPSGFGFSPLPAENRFMVYRTTSFRGDFRNMYPFAETGYDPRHLIYGPASDSRAGYLGFEMTASYISPVQGYYLEPNLVPGSVRVSVNGVPESRFDADITTGKVTLNVPVAASDRVEIRYRASSTTVSGGDILFAWKDTIAFSESLNLTLMGGIRWNADPWTYTQKAYAKSGTIMASAEVSGKGEGWSYALRAGVAYTNPDTSGTLRLFGMEGNSLSVDLSEENAFPASAPDQELTGLDKLKRGYLSYKDYRAYDAFGNAALQTIDWTGYSQTAYASGGRMGPYNVLGGALGATTGRSLVFDFDMASGEWVGAQLLAVAGGDADLSTARSVTIRYKAAVTNALSVSLQLGAVSEDLSGDGVLRAESSATEPGFPFTDSNPAHPYTLKVGGGPRGTGNGRLDSEDRNSTGVLELENPLQVTTLAIPVSAGSTGWTTLELPLSDQQRALLRQTRQIRVILTPAGLTPAQGTFLVDSLTVEGAAMMASAAAGTVSVREVTEALALSDPGAGSRLADRFSQVSTQFHANGEKQEVLEMSWNAVAPLLTVTGYAGADNGGIQYATVAFYYRAASPPGSDLTFSLRDPEGKGISWTVSPAWSALADGAWHEIRVSRAGSAVTVDGAAMAGAAPVFDAGFGSLSLLKVTTTAAAGLVYIDEMRLRDPDGALGAALVGEAAYEKAGTVLSVGGVPLLSNLRLRQSVSLVSPGFATLYGTPATVEDLSSSTEASADVGFLRIAAALLLREYGGSLTASGSHKVTVPATSFPVSLTDSFSLSWLGEFTREDSLLVSPFSGFTFSAETQASAARTDPTAGAAVLDQSWAGKAALSALGPFTLTADASVFQSSAGYPLPTAWYGETWVRQMSLVLPWAGGTDVEHKGSLGAALEISPSPFGMAVKSRAFVRSTDFTAVSRTQQNDLDLGVSATLRLGGSDVNALTLSLSYDRQVSFMTAPAAGDRFTSEAQSYGELMARQAYLLTGVPFAEIFTDNSSMILSRWPGVSRGYFAPTATVSLQRGYSSRLTDLLLPTSLDVTLGQKLERNGDLSSTTIILSPRLSSHALNLFGRLGAYPVLEFARTDAYSLSAAASLTGPPGAALRWTEVVAEASATVDGMGEEQLGFLHSFKRQETDDTVSLTDSTQVSYTWSSKPAEGVSVPFVAPELTRGSYLEHKETAEADLRYTGSGAYHFLTLVLGHATSLVLPGHGSVTGSLQTAFDMERLTETGMAFRVGLQAAVEAKFSF
jgi:hypothetical protein